MWAPNEGTRCGLPMRAPDVGSRRLCYRSSAEEKWFGSVTEGRGRTQHYALSYSPRPSALLSFVSCREVVRFCDRRTGAHSALCAFVQPPSLGSAIVRQLKRSSSVLCRLDHCGMVSLPLSLPRCLLVALCLRVRLPPDGRESSRQTQPCRRRSSSSTVRQRQTPSSCVAVITMPNPHAALVPSALLSFIS